MRSYEMNDTEFQRHLGALKGKLKDDVLTYQTAQGSANEHMDVEALIEEMEEAAGELDVKLRDYGWVLAGEIAHNTLKWEEVVAEEAPQAKAWQSEDSSAAAAAAGGSSTSGAAD